MEVDISTPITVHAIPQLTLSVETMPMDHPLHDTVRDPVMHFSGSLNFMSISICGLVVEYIVAIDVTRVRFPADAF